MSKRFLLFWLAGSFIIGAVVGVSIQRYHLPDKVLRQARSIMALRRARVSQTISEQNEVIHLKVEDFQAAVDPVKFDTEEDGHYVEYTEEIPISQLVLILIDVWSEHPNDGWREREEANVRVKLLPLLKAVRKRQILIVHSPHSRQIHKLVRPLSGEVVVNGPDEQAQLLKLLRQGGVKYLLYAGYASNMCVLNRPTGIIEMSKHGYQIILVRDASIAIEAPEFFDEKMTHKMVAYMVELNWGETTTVNAVVDALERH